MMSGLLRKIQWLLIIVLLSSAGSAFASPIVGIATADTDSTTAIGNSDADGRIHFYIPLTDVVETFGVDGGGLSYDTCSLQSDGSTCTGGQLEMFLYFPVVEAGSYLLNLDFGDFDAIGVNDPWFFLEALEIYDAAGELLATVVSAADLLASSNSVDQAYELLLTGIEGAFHIRLVFESSFNDDSPYGNYRNTSENLLATVSTIPEPSTLALLGVGLLMMGMTGMRRGDTKRALRLA